MTREKSTFAAVSAERAIQAMPPMTTPAESAMTSRTNLGLAAVAEGKPAAINKDDAFFGRDGGVDGEGDFIFERGGEMRADQDAGEFGATTLRTARAGAALESVKLPQRSWKTGRV